MGRRAKSFTLAERASAAKVHRHAYLQTDHAKELCAVQKYTTYWKVHGRKGSTLSSSTVTSRTSSRASTASTVTQPPFSLPSDLLKQALQPLPEHTYLFQEALASADNLDETDLRQWDLGPPYVHDTPSDSVTEMRYTERLLEVMHGRRLRQQQEREQERKVLCGEKSVELREILELELTAAWEEWKVGKEFIVDYEDGAREMTMAQLWVQWLARTVYYFHTTLESM